MTWHIDAGMLDAYLDDGLDFVRAASVEVHLDRCVSCRAAVSDRAGDVEQMAQDHERSWAELLDRVDQPRLTWVERLLMRCGVGSGSARVVASSELMGGWWLAGISVILCAALLTHLGADAAGVAVFLLVAPILPVAGVVLAYGAAGEPGYELAVVAPYSSFRRMLVRSGTAIAATLPAAGLVTLALPSGIMPALWLLPALTLTTATLAASTFTSPPRAAGAVAVVWLGLCHTMLVPAQRGDLDMLLRALPSADTSGQLLLLASGGAAMVVAMARRAQLERLTRA